MLAVVVKNPAFNQAEIDRVRTQTLTAIAQQMKSPQGLVQRALPPVLYGATHPYGSTGIGDPAAVTRFTRDDLIGFQNRWLRPDNLKIFVVSSLPLEQVRAELDKRFGHWEAPGLPKGEKQFTALPARPDKGRIILIDRPQSPQSVIVGAQLTPVDPRSDVTSLQSANDVIGGNFLSRINMDLRETRGWSYGVNGSVQINEHAVPYIVSAPVQADRTGESIAALEHDFVDFLTKNGVTEEELTRTVANNIQELPGRFESSENVLSAMQAIDLLDRPDNYYELLADKYRAQTRASLDAAVRAAVDPDAFVWIVVGDAAKVKPQLAKLKMPVKVVEAK
jgi:predicted Zn-dependent peptidase